MKKIDLPKKIPVFPLSNFIIFPRTTVPLNIFEPRYVEMVNDTMKNSRMIGLIQPKKTLSDKVPDCLVLKPSLAVLFELLAKVSSEVQVICEPVTEFAGQKLMVAT